MKNKTFFVLLAGILVFFGLALLLVRPHPAPTADGAAARLSGPFTASATIRMQELELRADINQGEDRGLTVAVTEPAALQGMTFSYDGTDIRVGYRGFTVKLDENARLVNSLASILVGAINKAAAPGGVKVGLSDGAVSLTGDCDSGQFEMQLDRKNGSLLRLRLPGLDFDCRFTEFAFG